MSNNSSVLKLAQVQIVVLCLTVLLLSQHQTQALQTDFFLWSDNDGNPIGITRDGSENKIQVLWAGFASWYLPTHHM